MVLLVAASALVAALEAQTSLPIALTGFTGDIVLAASETGASITGSGVSSGTTTSVSNWDFYETGATVTNGALLQGLPGGTRIFTSATNANIEFQLAPYTANNVVINSGTLTLTSPGRFQDLHFLVTAQGGSGNGTFNVTLNFSDASTTSAPNFTGLNDWTVQSSGGSNALLNPGLVGSGNQVYDNALYFVDFDYTLLPGDQLKTLDSFTVNYVSGVNTLMFFGASGTVAAIPEPASMAAGFAFFALGAAGVREHRRRRQLAA